MKLALADQDGVCVLTGSGEITEHDIQVLRAGLTKLFKSGKNRVVVDVPEADKLPPEMLRELSALDMLARELSGRIVLASIKPGLRDQIAKFAKPPIIDCVESREAAVKKLLAKGAEVADAAPAAPAVAAAAAKAAGPDPAAAAEALKKARADVRSRQLGEPTELRKQVAKLTAEVQLLTQQLHAAMLGRRAPAGEAAQKNQVEALEQEIAALIKEQQGAEGAAKPKG
ncbi:MAG TPA: hypothetical protein VM598_02695 [Bdellovibrionota bacterium]|nr:hypothetical protein [Bdellovibrionota bacterium]